MCATAVTCRALVYSMGAPLALMHALDAVTHTFCIAVAGGRGGAPDARDGRVGPAGTHVDAHEIKRTPNFGVRTRGAYVQPAILCVPRNFN